MSPADERPDDAAGQPEPMALAWQLASRKGWVDVDRALLTRLIFVPCMPGFPEGADRESWAAESAALWWGVSRLKHGNDEVAALASMLSAIHQDIYSAGHCHMAFIHLPDPRLLPLPVQLGIWAMEGERDEQLRLLVHADDPTVVDEPVLDEFTTDRLGRGLRCLRHRRGEADDGPEVDGYLDYAWRSEVYQTDLRLFTFTWGLERLQRAMPDIDELARAISVVPRT